MEVVIGVLCMGWVMFVMDVGMSWWRWCGELM